MYLNYSQVIDALDGFDVQSPMFEIEKIGPFLSFELFMGQPVEKSVLYVVDGPTPEGLDGGSFLEAGNGGGTSTPAFRVDSSAALVINALLRYSMRLSRCFDDMHERLAMNHDIQGFCQAIADFCGNPVIAYDAALLPSAQTEFPKDVARRIFFGSEKADRDFVLQTVPDWKRESGEDVFARTGARRIEDAEHRCSTVACNVISRDGFQGYLEIFEVHKPITDGEMALLEEAARIAAVAPFPFGESGLVLAHLQGRPIQGDLTASWLSALRWHADDGVYVIAIDIPDDRLDDKLYVDHIIRMTRLVVPFSVTQQMGEMPVVVANDRLVQRGKAIEDVAAFLAKLGDGARVGVSEIMTGVSHLHESFVHAQFAARYALEAKRGSVPGAMLFEECRFAFFSELCHLDENASLIVDARIARMYADDVETGSDNVRTVETYIETGFNLNATAKLLSVHRNTVAYRLKHIAERYAIDLASPIDDSSLVFQVLLSAKTLLGDS